MSEGGGSGTCVFSGGNFVWKKEGVGGVLPAGDEGGTLVSGPVGVRERGVLNICNNLGLTVGLTR